MNSDIRPFWRNKPRLVRAVSLLCIIVLPFFYVPAVLWDSRKDFMREVKAHWRIVQKGLDV